MRDVIQTDEQWAGWKQKAKAKSAPDDTLLTKKGEGSTGTTIKSVDDLFAFLKGASDDVIGPAMEKLEAVQKDGGAGAIVPFVISDEAQDRDGDIIELSGWDLAEFNRNPVMLFGHDHKIPAIGNGFGTHVSGKQLKSVAYYTAKDVHPFGHMIGRMVEEKVLRAASVGFIPKDWKFEEDRGTMAMRFLKQQLIEWSTCNVGSNHNALAEARSLGIDTDPMLDMAIKSLDGMGMLAMPRGELEAIYKTLAPGKTFSLPDLRAMANKTAEPEAPPAPEPEVTPEPEATKDIIIVPPAEAPAESASEPEADEEYEEGGACIILWQCIAIELAKNVDPEELKRLERLYTYAKTEKEEIATKSTEAVAKYGRMTAGIKETAPEPTTPTANVDEKPKELQNLAAIGALVEQSLSNGLVKFKAGLAGK